MTSSTSASAASACRAGKHKVKGAKHRIKGEQVKLSNQE